MSYPFPFSESLLLPYGGSLRVRLSHPPKANAWQFGILHECTLAGREDSLLRVASVKYQPVSINHATNSNLKF